MGSVASVTSSTVHDPRIAYSRVSPITSKSRYIAEHDCMLDLSTMKYSHGRLTTISLIMDLLYYSSFFDTPCADHPLMTRYEFKHAVINDPHRQLKVERLFISSTAPKWLKNGAALETISVLGISVIESKIEFMSIDERTRQRVLNHTNQVQLLSVKYILLKFQKDSNCEECSTLMQSMTDVILAENNQERFSEIIMKNAVLLMSDETVITLKLSEDGYYIMIIGVNDKARLNDIITNCHDGFKASFQNDISLIDVISEIPVVKVSSQECNHENSSCVVGEITPCNN